MFELDLSSQGVGGSRLLRAYDSLFAAFFNECAQGLDLEARTRLMAALAQAFQKTGQGRLTPQWFKDPSRADTLLTNIVDEFRESVRRGIQTLRQARITDHQDSQFSWRIEVLEPSAHSN